MVVSLKVRSGMSSGTGVGGWVKREVLCEGSAMSGDNEPRVRVSGEMYRRDRGNGRVGWMVEIGSGTDLA